MLEHLTSDEFDRFAASLRDTVQNADPFYHGMRLQQILTHIVETPNEFSADEWEPVLVHLGYDHEAQRYDTADLLLMLVCSMAAAPDASDRDQFMMWDRLFLLTSDIMEDKEFLSHFSDTADLIRSHWDESCHAFGWEFHPDGRFIDYPDD